LAIALGHRAVHAGYRVYYTTAADLVARTSRAAMDGRWANTMRFWAGPAVLIINELGYLPMPGAKAIGFAGTHPEGHRHRQSVLDGVGARHAQFPTIVVRPPASTQIRVLDRSRTPKRGASRSPPSDHRCPSANDRATRASNASLLTGLAR